MQLSLAQKPTIARIKSSSFIVGGKYIKRSYLTMSYHFLWPSKSKKPGFDVLHFPTLACQMQVTDKFTVH